MTGCAEGGIDDDDQCLTSLYRCWHTNGTDLLYIGITKRNTRRFGEHSEEKFWWQYVGSITLEHFWTYEEARAAEIKAIHEENPRYNLADRINEPFG